VSEQAMTNGSSGPGHDKCGGRTRSGGRCELPAGWGTPTPGIGKCKLHGGSTPNHQAHAASVLTDRAEKSALAELRKLGATEPVTNPLETLAELAGEAVAWQRIMREAVAKLEGLSHRTDSGTEQVRVLVSLYERAAVRSADLAATLGRLDVDERWYRLNQRITEAHVGQATALIELVLRQLGVSENPRRDPRVAPVVAAAWRSLPDLPPVHVSPPRSIGPAGDD
jgi:hypothetical protein